MTEDKGNETQEELDLRFSRSVRLMSLSIVNCVHNYIPFDPHETLFQCTKCFSVVDELDEY